MSSSHHHHAGPSNTSRNRPNHPQPPTTSSTSLTQAQIQRDRQARNKNPQTGRSAVLPSANEEPAAALAETGLPPELRHVPVTWPEQNAEQARRKKEELEWMEGRKREIDEFSILDTSYEVQERRAWAAAILDSPELLMMHAVSRNDSLPGTRLHFTRILTGYDQIPSSKSPPPVSNSRSDAMVED